MAEQPRGTRSFYSIRETTGDAAPFKKSTEKSVKDTCFLERIVGTVLGDSAQSLAGKLHANVATTATIQFRHPYTLLLQVGIYGTVDNFSYVTADTALLLGKTGAMNAAALVRHSKRDIANSGHKIIVRLMFSGATLYSFFISRQAKPLIFIEKTFLTGQKEVESPNETGHSKEMQLVTRIRI